MTQNDRLASKSASVGTSLNRLLCRLFVFHILIVKGLSLNSLFKRSTQVIMFKNISHLIVYVLDYSCDSWN